MTTGADITRFGGFWEYTLINDEEMRAYCGVSIYSKGRRDAQSAYKISKGKYHARERLFETDHRSEEIWHPCELPLEEFKQYKDIVERTAMERWQALGYTLENDYIPGSLYRSPLSKQLILVKDRRRRALRDENYDAAEYYDDCVDRVVEATLQNQTKELTLYTYTQYLKHRKNVDEHLFGKFEAFQRRFVDSKHKV